MIFKQFDNILTKVFESPELSMLFLLFLGEATGEPMTGNNATQST